MGRHSWNGAAARVAAALDALDNRLSRLGRFGSTAALTAMAVAVAAPLHVLVRTAEGLPVQNIAILNIALEISLVSAPIIFYAREVIAQLKCSRARLNELSRQLVLAAEEAERANRAKSAFLANMSHELRTPLNAILGFSEVMKDEHLGPMNNPRYAGYVGDIHASGRYLLGIIDDILDLSKIEAGKMTLEDAAEFPLRQALEGALGMCAVLGDRFGVGIASDLPPDEVRVVAVERMIRQIVINLVGNAIKFTPAGGRIDIGGGPLDDGGYAVTIKDSGVGMSEAEIAKALLPFGQVQNKLAARQARYGSTELGGTGLGLPLAKAMMELHGGALRVESAPGRGTLVRLYFPPSRIRSGRNAAAA